MNYHICFDSRYISVSKSNGELSPSDSNATGHSMPCSVKYKSSAVLHKLPGKCYDWIFHNQMLSTKGAQYF